MKWDVDIPSTKRDSGTYSLGIWNTLESDRFLDTASIDMCKLLPIDARSVRQAKSHADCE